MHGAIGTGLDRLAGHRRRRTLLRSIRPDDGAGRRIDDVEVVTQGGARVALVARHVGLRVADDHDVVRVREGEPPLHRELLIDRAGRRVQEGERAVAAIDEHELVPALRLRGQHHVAGDGAGAAGGRRVDAVGVREAAAVVEQRDAGRGEVAVDDREPDRRRRRQRSPRRRCRRCRPPAPPTAPRRPPKPPLPPVAAPPVPPTAAAGPLPPAAATPPLRHRCHRRCRRCRPPLPAPPTDAPAPTPAATPPVPAPPPHPPYRYRAPPPRRRRLHAESPRCRRTAGTAVVAARRNPRGPAAVAGVPSRNSIEKQRTHLSSLLCSFRSVMDRKRGSRRSRAAPIGA